MSKKRVQGKGNGKVMGRGARGYKLNRRKIEPEKTSNTKMIKSINLDFGNSFVFHQYGQALISRLLSKGGKFEYRSMTQVLIKFSEPIELERIERWLLENHGKSIFDLQYHQKERELQAVILLVIK